MRLLVLLLIIACANAAHATEAAPTGACAASPLAFWLGRWDVYVGEQLDGHNFIESTLDGCAIVEHWDDVTGYKGLSLFYLEPHAQIWKQVWLTDHARVPGGTKEKILIHSGPDFVRFQGMVWPAPDRIVLDRTTLRKLDDGRVSQVIERSSDGGNTWTVGYDAVYRRATAADAHP